ncbi:hypothetical protein TSUD_56130 [Trifolium subterraneum]|uniref:F-box domain-containing protein n=1 Tax=Trifolium subterraneum TaxID=3900 RepID=A0A2Z6MRV3_TRISU|nr:hypothetical protein TSUD_56130 [Trifolium subterraneum]
MMETENTDLPHELIILILQRLPVKSLIRFKCVCKSWFSLISSDTHFANSHFQLTAATHTHRALFISTQTRSIDLDASLNDDIASVSLNLNSTDDYLVVSMSDDHSPQLLEVFSLRGNTWKQVKGTHIQSMHAVEDDQKVGLFFNGAIHWFAHCLDLQKDVIVAFDLTERKLLDMHLPDQYGYEFDCCGLWVFREFLSLWARNYDNDTVEIWVMKEYKLHSSWTKTHVLPIDAIPTKYFSPLHSTKNGDIVGTNDHTMLVKYNDEGQLLGHCYCNDPHGTQVVMYTESLLSLPGDNVQA